MATVPVATGETPADRAATDTKSKPGKRSLMSTFDLTVARVMAILAALMLPGGFVALGLGWYGAAHTPFVFEQVPYLISGGLLGVGLLTGGGLLYIGSWMARLAEQQRDEGEKIRALITDVRSELRALPVAGTQTRQQTFVATRTGTMFHDPECSVVGGRSDLREVGPDEGLEPCKICQPTAG